MLTGRLKYLGYDVKRSTRQGRRNGRALPEPPQPLVDDGIAQPVTSALARATWTTWREFVWVS